ncbi:FAD synthase [uncultured archaeon]|nr:FAD synthase [uncultured archaeon]
MLKINLNDYRSENILTESKLFKIVNRLKKQGKKIGLCSGSFDLLHPGHVKHLESAKNLCDILLVAVAEDKFSANKKSGSNRPIFSQELRAYMISKLKYVDYVTFEDGTPRVIEILKPDLFIRGIDSSNEIDSRMIASKRVVESYGGKVVYTQDEKLSSSEIIEYIRKNIDC